MTEEILSAEAPVPGPIEGKDARKLDGWEKTAVEMGPLVAFGLGYFLRGRLIPVADGLLGQPYFALPGHDMFLALALFLPAFALAFAWSVIRTRRVAPILGVSGAIVTVLAVLTFSLGDETFIYVKPTIVYGLSAVLLAGGLLLGKAPLKLLFDGAFEMPDAAWRTLTWRFAGFNALAALANEVAWRTLTADCVPGAACAGQGTWVSIKLFGFTGAYFVFIAANAPFLMRHMDTPSEGAA